MKAWITMLFFLLAAAILGWAAIAGLPGPRAPRSATFSAAALATRYQGKAGTVTLPAEQDRLVVGPKLPLTVTLLTPSGRRLVARSSGLQGSGTAVQENAVQLVPALVAVAKSRGYRFLGPTNYRGVPAYELALSRSALQGAGFRAMPAVDLWLNVQSLLPMKAVLGSGSSATVLHFSWR